MIHELYTIEFVFPFSSHFHYTISFSLPIRCDKCCNEIGGARKIGKLWQQQQRLLLAYRFTF